MMSSFRKLITCLLLASFLGLVFFSFATMIHEPGERMLGDCPFSPGGVSLCPQDTLVATIHHLSAYYSFLNVPLDLTLTATMLSLLFVLGLILAYAISPPLFSLSSPTGRSRFFYFAPAFLSNRKTIRWLSLLENSPSLF